MIRITLRHLIRHWRLNLTVFLTLALGSTILISLSGYESVISNQELDRAFTQASPAERSLLITSTSATFDAAIYQHLQSSLGTALKERFEIRRATLQVSPRFAADLAISSVDLYSFDSIAGHVRLVEGRLPKPVRLSEAVGRAPPSVEAVIGAGAAEAAGYQLGDRVAVSLYHRFEIVGIVEPFDANDDAWGGDLSAFEGTPQADVLSLIISPGSMRANILQPIFPHRVYWRVTLDREHIWSEQVEDLRLNLLNFESQIGTHGATVISDLTRIFDEHQARLAPLHTMFFLLCLQSALILLFALAALASTRDQSSQQELSTFSARGAGLLQRIGSTALEALIISMPAALICGTVLAQVLILVWQRDSNTLAVYPFPGSIWLISAILAGAGWLALTLPVLFATPRETLGDARPNRPWVQIYSLDVYLFAFGGLLFWQLGQSDSFVTDQLGNNTHLFDPLLLAGPSLMLAASALLGIRLLPILARSIVWVVSRLQNSIFYLSFLRLSHDCRSAGWVLLIAGVVSAQATFDLVFSDTLISNPGMMQPALAEGLSKAVALNTVSLILFTCSLFVLLIQFMLQGRLQEFQVLRALGFSPRQGWIVLHIEFLLSLLLGVLLGKIFGVGLFLILFNYLAQIFSNATIALPVVDGWALAALDSGLLFTLGTALLLPVIRLPTRGTWAPLGAE